MADQEPQEFDVDLESLNGIQVADPACSKVMFEDMSEWLEELKHDLLSSPREMLVRISKFKNRREGESICDVFAIAGFHSVDGCLNELACQSDSLDEMGAFHLLDGTKEAIDRTGLIRQCVLSLAEELEAEISIRGGRFED